MTPETERELVTVACRALNGDTAYLDKVAEIARLTAALEEVRLYLVHNHVDVIAEPYG
jgi:hypothetical protein